MRKTKVKRPEKETATTAREEGHDSSLSGAPSVSKWELKAKLGLKNAEDMTITCRAKTILLVALQKTAKA